ncbi:mas-related G-protein coupled receptor member X1-like [Glossophaga mutica]
MNDSATCVHYNDHYNDTLYLEATRAQKVIAPLGVLICLGGLVGNGLVLGLLAFSVRWGDFTVFIFHLSLADFLYLSSQTVFFMEMILFTFHNIGFDLRYLFILTDISYWVGLYVLTAISVWRCLSVLSPIWCRLHAPRHAPAVACSLIWVLSVSVNVHLFLICWGNMSRNHEFCCMYEQIIFVFFCVLFSVTVICTLIVLVKVRCSTQRRPPLKFNTTVLLTVLFLLCAFPFGIHLYFVHYIGGFFLTYNLLLLLSCVNSSANPLVYYFAGRIGRRGRGANLREVFQKALGEESAPRRASSSGASTAQCEEEGGMRAGTDM